MEKTDLVADAREALAWIGSQRQSTHSERCHMWHTGCLVSRLANEVERLRAENATLRMIDQIPTDILAIHPK